MKTKWMTRICIVAAGMAASITYGISYNSDAFTVAAKGGDRMNTRIAGNFVVWQDTLEMKWFGYDLTERESFPIVAGAPMSPVINESYMVWSDGAMMSWNGFELATKRRFSLGITDADGMTMRLTGRFLVYRGMTDMKVHGMDLASGEKFVIASTDIEYSSLRAAGDYVVWRTQPWPGVLAGFQLSTREGFVVSTADMIDGMSMVMNDRFVAWFQTPADPTEAGLFGFDLTKREQFLITDEFINSMSLRIGGNYIIGQYMTGQALFGFDCVTRELFEMVSGNMDSMSLAVNDRYAIWRDMGSSDISGFELATRRLIFTGVESMYTPALAKSYFFWTLMPDPATTELRGFDLDTSEAFLVAVLSSGAPNSPIAGGDYVVWTDMVQPSPDTQLLGARIWKVPNDLCEEAAALTVGVPYLGDTSGALGTDLSSCGFEDWRDTWHEFRPVVGGEYTIDAHSEAFDTTLAISGACTGAETACNDDASIQTTDSRLVMTMVKGKRYLFRVAGVDGSGGPYALTISRGSCPMRPEGDLTGDCRVNMEDLAAVSLHWLDCGLVPAELCN